MNQILNNFQFIIHHIQYTAIALMIITVIFDSFSFIIMDKITFRIGIPIYIKKIPLNFSISDYIPNKKLTAGNVVYKFINLNICIFRKKYSFFSRNRQFLKGVLQFKEDHIKVTGIMPLSTVMLYVIILLLFFFSITTDEASGFNPYLFAVIFSALSFIFIFFGILSFRKTTEELLNNLKTSV